MCTYIHHLSIDFVNIEKKRKKELDLLAPSLGFVSLRAFNSIEGLALPWLVCNILAYWVVSHELRDVFVHSFEIFVI